MCAYVCVLVVRFCCLLISNEEAGVGGGGGVGGGKNSVNFKQMKKVYLQLRVARVVVFVLHRICLEEVSCCQVANWVHQKKGHLGCETK